ncbi:BglG family transcription antiterminator [Bacillus cytotoxicus]|uniref:Transcriptional antiterminator, BglG n=1 Tax=Bacillus cytotoxicus (strain DSM 22905 / CIP 110041 / 391-98 / NVH 391-98) TaxID=315749 RepID=A7GQ76_BACCN|nr:BglG family transcription antiterminator [Bacillus cytotoxicus]ABS22284.1 transcriptional antiterminator, BglG [Bacillus cytotoxicus NVH 391-98]AWC32887.1 PTS lichenan transporter subunit IIC [Bacillus cytotoxicus]AWC36913.1 PTS lichenan transporter subunit IIC [Bacillus cytotoxicus]AWC44954.1 PTS lichenan transporter subunit IIC [Bacillus cytotoxicus]AWC61174.1 PTS lichenan transporter subunit IIC [Bacillus cytotoxicus]
MILDYRSAAILQQMMQADSYTSVDQLTEVLQVSKRTIYYDMKKVDDWLITEHLEPIQYVRPLGYCLDKKTKQKVAQKLQGLITVQYEYSPQERKAWLALYLLTEEKRILLEDLIKLIQVSRNTTLADLKKLKAELGKFKLSLQFHRKQGYYIKGMEQGKRNVLIAYLSQLIAKHGWEYVVSHMRNIVNHGEGEKKQTAQDKLHVIKGILSKCEEFLGVQYTDEVLENLSVYMYLFCSRIVKGRYIEMEETEKAVLRETKHFQAATYIGTQFEKLLYIKFPKDEIYYITTHLLGAKVNAQQKEYEKNDVHGIWHIVDCMIQDFQHYACVIFRDFTGLASDLYLHMKPAFYRVKYGIEIKNPLLQIIRNSYAEVYHLTKKVVHHFEQYVGKEISEDEIAFITMHFSAWMRKEGIVPSPRKTALLVCPNGIGTSRMLQYQLEQLFSNMDILQAISKREYESNTFDVDCIITTTELEKGLIPIFMVNPILTDAEKASLFRKVNATLFREDQNDSADIIMQMIHKYADVRDEHALKRELREFISGPVHFGREEKYKPMLNELLTKEYIQLQDHVDSWEGAIRIAAKPLLQTEYISEEYVQEMIANVKKLGPYIVIAPKIAIPHARPESGVKKLGMSLLQLKESVSFSEKQEHAVNLIIVLAAIDNETHLKALAQLSDMLSQPENVDLLIRSNSKEQMLEMIAKYSN